MQQQLQGVWQEYDCREVGVPWRRCGTRMSCAKLQPEVHQSKHSSRACRFKRPQILPMSNVLHIFFNGIRATATLQGLQKTWTQWIPTEEKTRKQRSEKRKRQKIGHLRKKQCFVHEIFNKLISWQNIFATVLASPIF